MHADRNTSFTVNKNNILDASTSLEGAEAADHQNWYLGPRTHGLGLGIEGLGPGTWNLGLGTWGLALGL